MRRRPGSPGASPFVVFTTMAVTALLLLVAAFAIAQEQVDTSTLPKGIGPVEHVELGELDETLAREGKAVFEMFCTSCHKFGERYVGPDLAGVTLRRSPEWIMNMILNPEEMVFNDDTAYELLAEYMTQMPPMPITQEQTRAILEYFRATDSGVALTTD